MSNSTSRIPLATYRVQMTADFGFDRAAGLVEYLSRLGVSHFYASPYLQAGRGSTHGYDVVSHKRMNLELGGPAAHRRFCETLTRNGLGQVLDIVPNHMAISSEENDLWWDVLENGRASRYASYFDIDWEAPEQKLWGKVLLPVLGDHYGRVIDRGEIKLRRDETSFTVQYYDHSTPVAPESLAKPLATVGRRHDSPLLQFIAESLGRLPTAPDGESVARRRRDRDVLLRLLGRLLEEDDRLPADVDGVLAGINADPDALDALLDAQHYRLAYWRTAGRELNYRRFFNIDTLAGVAIENEEVFNETHGLLLRWIRESCLEGLRIDHIDGLRHPREYLQRLRTAAPGTWIVVEKILEPGEELPRDWPVAGTTGYDFLNEVGGLFVDPDAEQAMTGLYGDFAGISTDYHQIVRRKKHLMLRQSFGGELNRLTNLLVDISQLHRQYRDYSRHELHEAIREFVVAMPVYRTYVRARAGFIGEQDRNCIEQSLTDARKFRPDLDSGLWDLLRSVLLLELRGDLETDFVSRLQQMTGPVMAKGVEDTAFYVYNRLISLNEVGGDPAVFGIPVAAFHALCRKRQQHWPSAMLTTATHDTKRGEDTRLRISVLSEIPERWSEAVHRWADMNQRHRKQGKPDRNDEYMIYQTLVGAWPVSRERLTEFLLKAVREAKVHTNWIYPNESYEQAVTEFAERLLADERFVSDLESFVEPLRWPACVASLSQTLIKYTAPGVPDLYQGAELWDLSLVDPDNRRCVDYEQRSRMLEEATTKSPAEILQCMPSGLAKLFVITRAMHLRQRRPELFGADGAYEPLEATGGKADHVVAFVRGGQVIAVAPRLLVKRGDDWADTRITLPDGPWHNVLTGEKVRGDVALAELTKDFPVSLLELDREPT